MALQRRRTGLVRRTTDRREIIIMNPNEAAQLAKLLCMVREANAETRNIEIETETKQTLSNMMSEAMSGESESVSVISLDIVIDETGLDYEPTDEQTEALSDEYDKFVRNENLDEKLNE